MYVSRLWAPDVSNKPRYIKFTCSLKLIGLESPATFDKTSQYFEGHKVSTCATHVLSNIYLPSLYRESVEENNDSLSFDI